MNLSLIGKKALVCGSSQGIGLAAAQELALLGANITLLARNEESLRNALDSLHQTEEQEHKLIVADFGDPEQVKTALTFDNEYHILVNNTGGPPGGLAIDAAVTEFEAAFTAHLINNQILAQAVVPFMQATGFGRIINIISTSTKAPLAGLGVSNTVRGAVNSWSKTLANELGEYGITVNNVLPGATRTARLESIIKTKSLKQGLTMNEVEKSMKKDIPAGRFAAPEEIAAAVAFLASPAAGYINGISIAVDGGRTGCL